MSEDGILDSVSEYYEKRLAAHGPTSKGVDWNDDESQELRFRILSEMCPRLEVASVLDWGCGVGALLGYLERRGFSGSYTGFDIAEGMIAEARKSHSESSANWTTTPPAEEKFDFVIASGIFNVRLGWDDGAWEKYVKESLDQLFELSRVGMAVNFLSGYSDRSHMREDLYYADVPQWIDHVVGRYGRCVRLAHDYPLYEFSIYVGRNGV